MKSKRSLLSVLIDRMKRAQSSGWYLEAAWYAYAIIEDRLVSILRSSGGDGVAGGGKPLQMLGRKIREIERRIGDGPQKVILLEMNSHLAAVVRWADTRNDLMHAMAEGSMSIGEIDRRAKSLAAEALVLVPTLATGAQRLKRHKGRTPSVSGSATRSRSNKASPRPEKA